MYFYSCNTIIYLQIFVLNKYHSKLCFFYSFVNEDALNLDIDSPESLLDWKFFDNHV